MSDKKKPYDDPSNWEYDGGSGDFKGEIASPYINTVADDLMKQAFPEGREAFQKQQADAGKPEGEAGGEEKSEQPIYKDEE